MSDPSIVNQSPLPGATDVSAEDPLTFGLRDADTRVDLNTVSVTLVYAKTNYDSADEVLPTNTDGLPAVFSMFNDAIGAAEIQNPADQSASGGVYSIERTGDNDAEEGFLYLHEAVSKGGPIAAEASFSPVVTSIGASAYSDFTDWTGVLFGLIHWPLNKGIFLFFRDDSGMLGKYVTVAGPAEDENGARTSFATETSFDWSSDVWTYRILWDDTPARRIITVVAISSDGSTEVTLAEVDATAVAEFRAGFLLGGKGPSSGVASAVVGTDGQTAGDRIEVLGVSLYAFGGEVLRDGETVGGATISIASNSSLLLSETVDGWAQSGTGTLSGLTLTREEAEADEFVLTRAEPDLARKEWLVILFARSDESTHPGTYNTGVGIDVSDGSDKFSVRFLDDFDTRTEIGILSDETRSDLFEGYDTVVADWPNDEMTIVFAGSASENFLYLFYGDDETPAVSRTYLSTVADSTESVRIGFADYDNLYGGTFAIQSAWLMTNVTFYTGDAAPAGSWVTTETGNAATNVDGSLMLAKNTVGAYYAAFVAASMYTKETGATLYMKATVTAWTDSAGAVSPPGPIGPIGAILLPDDDTEAVQLYLYQSSSGEMFACLPHSEDDFDEVARQTSAGQAISAQVDFTAAHVYILVVNPLQHVRLYIDYATTPAIDVNWANFETVQKELPSPVPTTSSGDPVVAAFGSLHEERGVAAQIAFAHVSVGTGYDISAAMSLSDDDLTQHVFGAKLSSFFDFSDED